jgi:hypothetical protein
VGVQLALGILPEELEVALGLLGLGQDHLAAGRDAAALDRVAVVVVAGVAGVVAVFPGVDGLEDVHVDHQ